MTPRTRIFLAILRKEWRLLRAARLVPLLLLLATFAAVRNGTQAQAERLRAAQSFQQIDAARYQKLQKQLKPGFPAHLSSPYVGSYYGLVHAVLPPHPLGFVAQGQADLLPGVLRIGLKPHEALLDNASTQNPSALRWGAFDLAFVVVFLMPLLLIALLHDVYAGEHEGGRLALALSQPVTPAFLLSGAVLVRTGLVLLPLLLGIPAAVIFYGHTGADMGSGLVLIESVTLGYGIFWAALCTLVSVRQRSSGACATALGGLWAILVVAAPAGISLAASARYPIRSAAAVEAAVVRNETNDRLHEDWNGDNELFRPIYERHPHWAPPTVTVTPERIVDRSTRRAREARVVPAISFAVVQAAEPYETEMHRQALAREVFAGTLATLLPSAVTYDAFAALARNDRARSEAFLEQARAFRAAWDDFFTRRLFREEKLTADDYNRLPRFAFQEAPSHTVLRPALLALSVSLAWALLCGCFVAARLTRVSPTGA